MERRVPKGTQKELVLGRKKLLVEEKQLLLDTTPGEGRKEFLTYLLPISLQLVSSVGKPESEGARVIQSVSAPQGYTAGWEGVESTSGEQEIENAVSLSELGKRSH